MPTGRLSGSSRPTSISAFLIAPFRRARSDRTRRARRRGHDAGSAGGRGHIADAVATSLEGSLSRLSLECVDIFHLHNAITDAGGGEALSVRQVLDYIVPAFERLRQAAEQAVLERYEAMGAEFDFD
jgi:aryl-alcohol dehydrogenase-like predicted oxidoreductase